jgi:hypothetical protein
MLLDSLNSYLIWFTESNIRLRGWVGLIETIKMDYSLPQNRARMPLLWLI